MVQLHSSDSTTAAAGADPAAGRSAGGPSFAGLVTGITVLVVLLLLGAWIWESQRSLLLVLAALAGAGAAVAAATLSRRSTARPHDVERSAHEPQMRRILESAMDPVIAVDDDQRIVIFNAAAEQVFGWPRGAVLGRSLDMLIPDRFRTAHRAHLTRFGETGVTSRRMGAQRVLSALRASGEEFPIEASISQHVENSKRLYTVIVRDVSERARAETMLARSEARLRGILDSAMDAILTVDESQHVVLFNAAAEVMFLCPREQALGAPLSSFIPERFRAAHVDHIGRFGETGVAARRMASQRIVTGLRRNGEEFPIDASISQLTESQGKFYTVILRDVTERVRADAALLRSREELRELGAAAHMTREHEKTRIARELHDELGQSLTMLQMDVAWCRDRVPPDDASGFSSKLERMESLLRSTAAATRRIAADLRPLMLDDLGLPDALEWLVQDFTDRTGVACSLRLEDPALALPDLQSNVVFRIVQESLANIAKHAKASRAEVAIERERDQLLIRVSDDGAGFSLQAPRRPDAYGLIGLRERASMLNGEIAIDSAPGEGTRIEVRLPLVAGDAW